MTTQPLSPLTMLLSRHTRRREFISVLGGAAAAWPLGARAQQPTTPVVGFLSAQSPTPATHLVNGFRRGLAEAGYVEGQNVAIEYRFTEGRVDRLAEMAADLVYRHVSVIALTGTGIALGAKAATKTIPIVFGVADDPVKLGLVASLNRPGGNATGINFLLAEVAAKRLALLRELVPSARQIAALLNPANAPNTTSTRTELDTAASTLGLQVGYYSASNRGEIDTAFEALVADRPDALFIAPDAFFDSRRVQLNGLAARHALPTSYPARDMVEAGGLMSYGTNMTEVHHQVGVYAGRILKGAKPADLPVVQSTKFELVINLQTAKLLGLEVPPTLLARADEVIE
jgi:putative tryptophan/tyrosine transport system substrate-binding protein